MAFRRLGLVAFPAGKRNTARLRTPTRQDDTLDQTKRGRLALAVRHEKAFQFIKTFAGLSQLRP
jgi:hypothetical protein